MRIVPATTNMGKINEIRAALKDCGFEWVEPLGSGLPPVEETGETFAENARIKAQAARAFFDLPALADDSGLEVDVLDGLPGVRSARFAGPGATDADNIAKVVGELKRRNLNASPARFVCEMVLAWPDGRVIDARGVCEGSVMTTPRGSGGFGYDPIFVPAGSSLTMAELSPEEKNKISHRGHALLELRRLVCAGEAADG